MNSFSFSTVRSMGCFSGGITSYMALLTVFTYVRRVRTLFKPFMVADTFETKFIALFRIGLVLTVGRLSQVIKSVVSAITVSMIYLFRGPSPRHIEPRQTMLSVVLSVDLQTSITFMMRATGTLSDTNFWPRQQPREPTGYRIVMKNFTKLFMPYHVV